MLYKLSMKKTVRQVRKKIWSLLSIEDKLHETMLRKIHQFILKGRESEAAVVGSASKILFPKKGEEALCSTIFDALWKKKQYRKAVRAYRAAKRPFWHALEIGKYYEKNGLIKKAMIEYEHLMNAYSKMGKDFLPLPNGPMELVKLGRWYASKDTAKAKKYLKLYLSAAEVWKTDPALHLPHKTEAKRLLAKLAR